MPARFTSRRLSFSLDIESYSRLAPSRLLETCDFLREFLVKILDVLDDNLEERGVILLRGRKLINLSRQSFVRCQHLSKFDERANDENVHLYARSLFRTEES